MEYLFVEKNFPCKYQGVYSSFVAARLDILEIKQKLSMENRWRFGSTIIFCSDLCPI